VRPAQAGEAPLVSIEPANDSVHFAVAARTGDGASNSLQITQLDDRSYKITGHLPVGAAETVRRFALADPALYAAEVLKSLLEKAGIIVRGTVRKGKTSEGAEVLAEIPGPPLAEVLRDMNHHSLNVVADNLLLSLGANRFGLPGTRENGVEAVEEFLEGLGLPMNEVTIYDGSGLSDRNRVTANFMARYLVAVTKKPWFEEFRNSLPRPGYEGTLKEIGFKDERFRVKSGRLENVYALAGYGVNGSGKDVAFSFMVNGPGIGILPYMDEIGAEALRFIANESFQ
jgi:D-alanyl-D-alanine carboxypeptidase/D-alanyl-D-alanine-endopeptidase (penicillin-binding protein 4)